MTDTPSARLTATLTADPAGATMRTRPPPSGHTATVDGTAATPGRPEAKSSTACMPAMASSLPKPQVQSPPGPTSPVYESDTDVEAMMRRTSAGERPGQASSHWATVPVTTGAAIDVPCI